MKFRLSEISIFELGILLGRFGILLGLVANNQQMSILKYIFLVHQCLLVFLQKALLRKRAAPGMVALFLCGLQQHVI